MSTNKKKRRVVSKGNSQAATRPFVTYPATCGCASTQNRAQPCDLVRKTKPQKAPELSCPRASLTQSFVNPGRLPASMANPAQIKTYYVNPKKQSTPSACCRVSRCGPESVKFTSESMAFRQQLGFTGGLGFRRGILGGKISWA